MNRSIRTTKQVIAAALFAVAGTAAVAGTVGSTGDITRDTDAFVATKSRAAVNADVLAARAAGVTQFVTESHASVANAPASRSALTREQVRADLRNAPRAKVVIYNPAA